MRETPRFGKRDGYSSKNDSYKGRDKKKLSGFAAARSGPGRVRVEEQDFLTMNIPLGSKDGFTKKDLFNLINRQLKGKQVDVGKITIKDKYSIVELPAWAIKSLEKKTA